MRCTILASGSKGNCVFLEERAGRSFLDAGLSTTKRRLLRMRQHPWMPGQIGAITGKRMSMVTISGVLMCIARRQLAPVYYNRTGTLHCFPFATVALRQNGSIVMYAGIMNSLQSGILKSSRLPPPMMLSNPADLLSGKRDPVRVLY